MWFIGVGVEQETSAPPPKKNFWIRPLGPEGVRLVEVLLYYKRRCNAGYLFFQKWYIKG